MREQLTGKGKLKATMLKAHIAWAEEQSQDLFDRLGELLGDEDLEYLNVALLATEWIPFDAAVRIDRSIARVVGGDLDDTLRQMGRHSAAVNLGGVYRFFIRDEPHRFFTRMMVLHRRFQSFGDPAYEQTGDRSGSIQIGGCEEYSKVYCRSAQGYYQGALEMMKVPGPVRVQEVSCQCDGDPNCIFDLRW